MAITGRFELFGRTLFIVHPGLAITGRNLIFLHGTCYQVITTAKVLVVNREHARRAANRWRSVRSLIPELACILCHIPVTLYEINTSC